MVADLGGIDIAVKAVGVFHGEFTPAHQAKAGPALIPEFGLDLVEVFGQLLVALDLLSHDVGHHLFAGGLDHVIAFMPVFDAQQLGAHFLEAPGFLPQLGGLHHRHADLDSASPVHLLAHDRFDLADHPQTHGHVAVNTGSELFDHPRPHHQFVAGDLGVGGGFFEGGDQELGGFHRAIFPAAGGLLVKKMRPCIMVQV